MKQLYNIQKILEITKGRFSHTCNPDVQIENLLIDSRRVFSPKNTLFIAIKGDRHDGHDFVYEAHLKGIRNFIVQENSKSINFQDSNVIRVPNTLFALQEIATYHRKQFKYPVIGITGSNGKTIVKEWLSQLLKDKYEVVKSPKSYNSQVGVPLSLWQMKSKNNLGIFEAGISKEGEMGALELMIQPNIGVITNIGRAHDENFKNWEEKTKEKLRLFENCKQLVYCKDYLNINQTITTKPRFSKVDCFTWSKKSTADLMISKISKSDSETLIKGIFNNAFIEIKIPFIDDASIENCITCWATLLMLKHDQKWIVERLKTLTPVAMRLELKEGINNCSIINDYYNSDVGSLEIAIDFMMQQKQQTNKVIVLSDILESGVTSKELYSEVIRIISSKGIKQIIGVGPKISAQQELFPSNTTFYYSTDDFLKQIEKHNFSNSTILLKGARPFGFEKISSQLQKKVHETVLEINLTAVVNNFNYFKSKLQPSTKVMAMVKAFSYGAGSYEISHALQFNRVDYLAVAYADEGVELRKAGITTPIMVMNPEQQGYELMIQHHLEPEIYSFKGLELFEKALNASQYKDKKGFPIHVKLDTGMHRLGFEEQDIHELIIRLKNKKSLTVKSIFSHLATSDEPHQKKFTLQQIELFTKLSNKIQQHLEEPIIRHILNSAGISAFPDAQFDMVRLGIGMYGISPFSEDQKYLQPVSELKTTISQIKRIPAHDSVGYSRTEMPIREIVIATLPIGYADGLRRSLGQRKGFMFINGKKAPIVGNVCMDMCMLDITDIDANEGDEVIVFGKNNPVQAFAKAMDTIPYEALTGISPRVKRIYYQE